MSPRSESDLRRRQKTTADVLTRHKEVNELEDGYAFRYPRTKAWSEKLQAFTTAWSESCPHMTFEVVSINGQEWLHIRGPEGTKQFVEGARYMLTSHINPAASLQHKVRHALRFFTSPLRTLPDFIIVGAKKCGTTALYSYLTQHSSIAPAFKKEIYYFNVSYAKGRSWYRAFFPTVLERQYVRWTTKRQLLSGEATPDYLFNPHAARRAFETVPQARLIAILRNPVDRAFSFYNHNLRAGLESLSFEDAIDQEEERLAGERDKTRADEEYFSFEYEHHSYLARGVYVDQLEDWLAYFSRSQLLVLSTEDLYNRPSETLGRALDFLGQPRWEPKEFKTLNSVPYPEMHPETREKLQAYFEPHNRRLYEFLDSDLGW